MIETITITVQSALLFIAGAASQPEPYCVVQVSPSINSDLFHAPEGGCSALGEAIKGEAEREYPSTPVLLIVDGKTNQGA